MNTSSNGAKKMKKLISRYDITSNSWLVGYWNGRTFVVLSKAAA